jgi:hypothetical protein
LGRVAGGVPAGGRATGEEVAPVSGGLLPPALPAVVGVAHAAAVTRTARAALRRCVVFMLI